MTKAELIVAFTDMRAVRDTMENERIQAVGAMKRAEVKLKEETLRVTALINQRDSLERKVQDKQAMFDTEHEAYVALEVEFDALGAVSRQSEQLIADQTEKLAGAAGRNQRLQCMVNGLALQNAKVVGEA